MSKVAWQKTIISPCETFHLTEGMPLYDQRFTQVMKYHAPGLAPAKDHSGAFHITIKGEPAYDLRFTHTFGFYENVAAVSNEHGWFHIQPSGEACYKEYYAWCGNFQEGFCTVKDQDGLYFHIDQTGQKSYLESYAYVGDYKDGIAVVCNQEGLHSHIDYNGTFIHQHWFKDLDIFHKGYARARDESGWFHVDKLGKAIYSERYAQIEPFYNNAARVETFEGALLIISTTGEIITELRSSLQKP